jgi:thioredoxin 1
MNKPIHINDEEFQQKVLNSPLPVIVDFWAPWCGPCRMIAPVLEQFAREYQGKLVVAKVNTDENPEWAIKYGVQGIPTLLFIAGGEVKDRQVGVGPAPALKAKLEAFLSAQEPVQTT